MYIEAPQRGFLGNSFYPEDLQKDGCFCKNIGFEQIGLRNFLQQQSHAN